MQLMKAFAVAGALALFCVAVLYVLTDPCDNMRFDPVSSGAAEGVWEASFDQSEFLTDGFCSGLRDLEFKLDPTVDGKVKAGVLVADGVPYRFWLSEDVEDPGGQSISFQGRPHFLTHAGYRDRIELIYEYCLPPLTFDSLSLSFGNYPDGSSRGYPFTRK